NLKNKDGKTLLNRPSQGRFWWEIQTGKNVLEEFEKEKIVWQHVSGRYPFAFVDKGFYLTNALFMITHKNNNLTELKILLAILNSKMGDFLLLNFTRLSTLGQYAYGAKDALEQIPLPPITPQNQHIVQQIESLVNQILNLTQSDDYETNPAKQNQVKELEAQIDQLVYQLYGLTEEEIRIIEGGLR
ncbi:MAG: TaqI-like C-terminal specificity domain-containing protein, partial [Caldimicrobium sp.]